MRTWLLKLEKRLHTCMMISNAATDIWRRPVRDRGLASGIPDAECIFLPAAAARRTPDTSAQVTV